MSRVKTPLFQWSLAALLLSLLPLTGIVLGVLSWRRKELKAGWIIVILVFNAVQLLLIFLRLFFVLQG